MVTLVFLFVFAVIKVAASAATSTRYKSSTSGLGSLAEPTDEEIKADAKAAQDRDLLQLLGMIVYIVCVVFAALSGGILLPHGIFVRLERVGFGHKESKLV